MEILEELRQDPQLRHIQFIGKQEEWEQLTDVLAAIRGF